MSPIKTPRVPVIGAKPGTTVQPEPGKKFAPITPDSLDRVALAELVPAGDGTFRAVARICPRYFTIRQDNLRRLGVAISAQGMIRLVRAGFVAGCQATPGITQFDYFDYLRHEGQVAADPDFWDTRQEGHILTNRERYRRAIISGREPAKE
jgi:hypothetical protein